jgi:hypothetical protein
MTPMARIRRSQGVSRELIHSDRILSSLSVSSVPSVVRSRKPRWVFRGSPFTFQ